MLPTTVFACNLAAEQKAGAGNAAGCTVVQDLGDGYTATYGQLANLTCSEGDVLEAGDTLGAVGKVTRYYTVEGTNVYFAMEQDGKPVNPMDYFGDI